MDPLSELKDIYIPPAVDHYQLANGGYLVFSLFIISFLILFWRLYLLKDFIVAQQTALKRIQHLRKAFDIEEDSIAITIEISQFLRRIAIKAFPHHDVVNLNGEAWLAFLDQTANTQEFSQGVGKRLDKNKVEKLFDLATYWVKSNYKVTKPKVSG